MTESRSSEDELSPDSSAASSGASSPHLRDLLKRPDDIAALEASPDAEMILRLGEARQQAQETLGGVSPEQMLLLLQHYDATSIAEARRQRGKTWRCESFFSTELHQGFLALFGPEPSTPVQGLAAEGSDKRRAALGDANYFEIVRRQNFFALGRACALAALTAKEARRLKEVLRLPSIPHERLGCEDLLPETSVDVLDMVEQTASALFLAFGCECRLKWWQKLKRGCPVHALGGSIVAPGAKGEEAKKPALTDWAAAEYPGTGGARESLFWRMVRDDTYAQYTELTGPHLDSFRMSIFRKDQYRVGTPWWHTAIYLLGGWEEQWMGHVKVEKTVALHFHKVIEEHLARASEIAKVCYEAAHNNQCAHCFQRGHFTSDCPVKKSEERQVKLAKQVTQHSAPKPSPASPGGKAKGGRGRGAGDKGKDKKVEEKESKKYAKKPRVRGEKGKDKKGEGKGAGDKEDKGGDKKDGKKGE